MFYLTSLTFGGTAFMLLYFINPEDIISKDGVLIGWTDKTSYTFKPDNIYGTYKVIGTYKSYNDIQSDEAVLVYKEPDPTPIPTPDNPTPTEPEEPPEEETTP